jgi:hypothetical protein
MLIVDNGVYKDLEQIALRDKSYFYDTKSFTNEVMSVYSNIKYNHKNFFFYYSVPKEISKVKHDWEKLIINFKEFVEENPNVYTDEENETVSKDLQEINESLLYSDFMSVYVKVFIFIVFFISIVWIIVDLKSIACEIDTKPLWEKKIKISNDLKRLEEEYDQILNEEKQPQPNYSQIDDKISKKKEVIGSVKLQLNSVNIEINKKEFQTTTYLKIMRDSIILINILLLFIKPPSMSTSWKYINSFKSFLWFLLNFVKEFLFNFLRWFKFFFFSLVMFGVFDIFFTEVFCIIGNLKYGEEETENFIKSNSKKKELAELPRDV